jgi:hypothetical protein
MLRDSDAIILTSALHNGLVAISRGVDSGSRFAERLSVLGRRSMAAQTHKNDAININSSLIDSWVPSLVVRFCLRRDVDELPRGAGTRRLTPPLRLSTLFVGSTYT